MLSADCPIASVHPDLGTAQHTGTAGWSGAKSTSRRETEERRDVIAPVIPAHCIRKFRSVRRARRGQQFKDLERDQTYTGLRYRTGDLLQLSGVSVPPKRFLRACCHMGGFVAYTSNIYRPKYPAKAAIQILNGKLQHAVSDRASSFVSSLVTLSHMGSSQGCSAGISEFA